MTATVPSLRLVALVPAVALALACVLAPGAGIVRGATHTVDIVDFAFSPATLTITAGDTVTWTNLDAIEHTATSTSGAFDSGLLAQNESWSLTFTTPGTYDYLCTPHPTMTGQIVVVAAAAPAPTTAPASSAPPAGGGNVPDVAMPPDRAARWPIIGAGLALVGSAALLTVRRVRRGRREA